MKPTPRQADADACLDPPIILAENLANLAPELEAAAAAAAVVAAAGAELAVAAAAGPRPCAGSLPPVPVAQQEDQDAALKGKE